MKCIALILSFWVLTLLAFPTLIAFLKLGSSNCTKTCCTTNKPLQQPNGNCQGASNPFMNCCNTFLASELPVKIGVLMKPCLIKFQPITTNPLFDFENKHWHPPQNQLDLPTLI